MRGSINDVRMYNGAITGRQASCANALTSSGVRPRCTTTIRGAGRWPATRRSNAGSAKSTRAASRIRASSGCRARRRARRTTGERAPPVRARHRCAADGARVASVWDTPARRSNSVAQSPDRRDEHAVRGGRTSTHRSQPRHAVLRDARVARASTTKRLESSDVPPPRQPVRRRPRRRTHRSTTTCGSFITSAEDLSETHDLAAAGTRSPRRR